MTTDERNRFIKEQLDAGASLSDVQKMLQQQFGITVTYLDLRLLAAELRIDWKKQDREKESVRTPPAAVLDAEEPRGRSRTRVTLSKVLRPGMQANGEVEFASGAKGEWYVDGMGRLGLTQVGSRKPTQEDIQEFQVELQRKLTGY